MDIETQVSFIDKEIQEHTEAISALQAIKDTITEMIAPKVASIIGLQERIDQLENPKVEPLMEVTPQ